MSEGVTWERDGSVARVWLDRPEAKNALTADVLRRLSQIADTVDEDESLRAMVIRGRNGTFCSGFDLGNLQRDFLGERGLEIAVLGAKTCERIASMRTPTVAVLEGHTTAGGFEIMLACDFAVAARSARIGDFHIRRGLFGGAGPIYRVPRLVGMRRAKELLMTGKLISSDEALDWGLINAVHGEEELDAGVDEFVGTLTDKSPLTMWLTKMTVNRGLDADTESLMVMEHLAVGLTMKSDDAAEGVTAFLEKREPRWTGS